VLKVDVSALSGAPTSVSVVRVHYAVVGMVATLLWDANTDVRILDLAGNGTFDLEAFGGLPNNASTGVTGDILLTTTGHSSGDSYAIVLEMRKQCRFADLSRHPQDFVRGIPDKPQVPWTRPEPSDHSVSPFIEDETGFSLFDEVAVALSQN
jgi:hypothetical protein